MDIETCIRNYLTSGEFNHEAYHPARDFLSGLLDITIVKPVIEFFTGTDLITGERLTEAQKYQKMAGAIVDMFTFGQGLAAMKGAGLVGKELCKAFGKTMLVEVASSASAYTVGYGVEAMGLPPQIAWMLGAATGCIVSTAGMNLVFRNPQTGVVRECSLEEITSLEKLDASEIDITKLGKEVPTDDLELYMRYQKEGSIEHFTDGEKKTISRIETMGITGDECEEILRARGKEVTRPQIEKPEAVLPPRNESETIESGTDVLDEIERIDEIKIKFNYNSKYDEAEFARQLADQQKGMNELTVREYLDNRQKYIEQGRAIESNAAQQAAREKAFVDKVDELQDAGLSLKEAEEQAEKWLDTQAALHNPDQVAGGYASNVGGVGDKGVNSSIGSQWRYRIDDVDAQIKKWQRVCLKQRKTQHILM